MLGDDESLGFHLLEQGDEGIVVPVDVQDAAWFFMETELSSREDFEKFFHRPGTTW